VDWSQKLSFYLLSGTMVVNNSAMQFVLARNLKCSVVSKNVSENKVKVLNV